MDFKELKRMVNQSKNIVFFGGAGTSTESGIPDFRSADGLYQTNDGNKFEPEEILSLDFFMNHVNEFYEFYKTKMLYPDAKPNLGHRALVKLEERGQLKAIITQNIDGLHQAAGSKNVVELHGSVHRNRCIDCQKQYSLGDTLTADVPYCVKCGGIVKPEVVLYQENLDSDDLQRASSYIKQADVFIVAGTSLSVQPAAGLIRFYQGNKMILINKSATPFDGLASYIIPDEFAKVMHALVNE